MTRVSHSARAAVLEEKDGPFVWQDIEIDGPRPDEVLVRMVATGICATDAHVRRQQMPVPLPVVLGHEGAGIVERVGSAVAGLEPGDHVVLSYHSCGRCPSCVSAHPAYCDLAWEANFAAARLDGTQGLHRTGAELHGHFFGQSSFATHALTHQRNTVKIPSDIPLELAAPLGVRAADRRGDRAPGLLGLARCVDRCHRGRCGGARRGHGGERGRGPGRGGRRRRRGPPRPRP
ncbi:alcohol dehydrogenase catalytic domain-containing protein [Streptomyces sp. NPDC005774]|uniref:alcohol dehydrogenase catalytic domain-containing protein n=1 Tax=Streptomyces sp. NPDC005774 TaxID=3364728 RepID=UPI0036957582